LAYENFEWSNSSRTILDFRAVPPNSQTRILHKLKNNFNVEYHELSPEVLKEVGVFFKEQNLSFESNQLDSKKFSSTNPRELAKQPNNPINFYKNVVLSVFKLSTAPNKLDKYLNPAISSLQMKGSNTLSVENKCSFHGKEIFGFKGTLESTELGNIMCILKRPKNESINLEDKIKAQLVAQELANQYSMYIFYFKYNKIAKLTLSFVDSLRET
jgi:hypothetical protein